MKRSYEEKNIEKNKKICTIFKKGKIGNKNVDIFNNEYEYLKYKKYLKYSKYTINLILTFENKLKKNNWYHNSNEIDISYNWTNNCTCLGEEINSGVLKNYLKFISINDEYTKFILNLGVKGIEKIFFQKKLKNKTLTILICNKQYIENIKNYIDIIENIINNSESIFFRKNTKNIIKYKDSIYLLEQTIPYLSSLQVIKYRSIIKNKELQFFKTINEIFIKSVVHINLCGNGIINIFDSYNKLKSINFIGFHDKKYYDKCCYNFKYWIKNKVTKDECFKVKLRKEFYYIFFDIYNINIDSVDSLIKFNNNISFCEKNENCTISFKL